VTEEGDQRQRGNPNRGHGHLLGQHQVTPAARPPARS
jgi:hypothetical protein